MENVYVINSHPIFSENALCLASKLKVPIIKDLEPKSGDLYIVFGAHEITQELLFYQRNHKILYIIMNSEQISSPVLKNKFYIQLMKQNILFDYNKQTSQYLKETYNVLTMSYYFFEFIETEQTEQTETDRPIDILFVGSHTKARQELYEALKNEFPEKNIEFEFSWKYKNPLDMKEILQKSKYVINIPYYINNTLETHRINNALSAGCQVVSLRSNDEDADHYYKDYIYFTDNIVEWFKFEKMVNQPPIRKYTELILDLNQKLFIHNYTMIQEIKKNMPILYANEKEDKQEI
jgi:hypothetical protein